MRPGTTRVVTRGSYVWLDGTAMEYLRLPLGETPRERPEWSDERAGVLQDAVWHPMTGWEIGPHPDHNENGECCFAKWCETCPGLMIGYIDNNGEPQRTWFPDARPATYHHPSGDYLDQARGPIETTNQHKGEQP